MSSCQAFASALLSDNSGIAPASLHSVNPKAFISAITRLVNQNLADADPPDWVEFLLHSHPSISKRVTMSQSFRVEE
jgi:Zn-dependent protease with chaperone function